MSNDYLNNVNTANGALAMQNIDLREYNIKLKNEIRGLKAEIVRGKFQVGQRVRKIKGYKFPGVVIGLAKKLDGKVLYLVECMAIGAQGMCHIFGESDLEVDSGQYE